MEEVEPEKSAGGVRAFLSEASDGCGDMVEVVEELGAGEAEEVIFISGIQVRHAGGPDDLDPQPPNLAVGEGSVEGYEAGHRFRCFEAKDSERG